MEKTITFYNKLSLIYILIISIQLCHCNPVPRTAALDNKDKSKTDIKAAEKALIANVAKESLLPSDSETPEIIAEEYEEYDDAQIFGEIRTEQGDDPNVSKLIPESIEADAEDFEDYYEYLAEAEGDDDDSQDKEEYLEMVESVKSDSKNVKE